ncbi:MAG: hypothetical protein RIS70_2555 [Planctomycetota bacterium]
MAPGRFPGPTGFTTSELIDPGTFNRATSPAPGPFGAGATHADVPDGDLLALRELGLDLLQMALDLAGIVDPSPVSDGASGLLSLARGQWFDAVLSGVSMIPYVGDLAKAGKLPKYLQTLERAVELAGKSAKAAEALLPGLQKLKQTLDLIPNGANKYLDRMKTTVDGFLVRHAAQAVAKRLPDISKRFDYRNWETTDRVYKQVSGRLGVPGSVMRHRSKSAQSAVSSGTGDHAGHLIGDRFGASGGAANLSRQNWKANSYGTYHSLEDEWARKLKEGSGIEVTVTDITRKGEDRPFMRRVEWTEISPDGKRLDPKQLDFANTHTPESRAMSGIEPTVTFPQKNNVIHADFVNKTRLR